MTTSTRPADVRRTTAGRKLTRGQHVINWIEQNCVHTNGEWIGKPFRFLPWQKILIYELFELNPDTMLRRYRWALIGEPKKNGKTEMLAAIALYLLIADGEPAALVICAAASDEQADLVFGAAKIMATMSPTLSAICEIFANEIRVPTLPGSRLVRVAAAVGTNDGKNVHAVICDELHEWIGPKGRGVWTVLTNGIGARRQPLILQISTAGSDLETVLGEQYLYGRRVESGEVNDPAFYFHWDQAPDGCDYKDPEMWKIANPSYGVLVHAAFFADQLGKKLENSFRRYFLNQWTVSEDAWMGHGEWDACLDRSLELDEDLPLYVGIDVALRHDSTAVVATQNQNDRVVVRAWVWENPYPEGDPRHDSWTLNIFEVEDKLRELYAKFPEPAAEFDDKDVAGPEFAYDPAYFQRSAQVLEGDGLAMVEFPQQDSRMVPASQNLYQAIKEKRIAHDGNPTLARHIQNVVPDQRPRGWRISKPKGTKKKIDAAIGLAIAAYLTMASMAKIKSVYDEHGLIVLRGNDDDDDR